MILTIESPQERPGRPFSPFEAAAVLRSWYRVVKPDGSTMAYAPDQATAEFIAEIENRVRSLEERADQLKEVVTAILAGEPL